MKTKFLTGILLLVLGSIIYSCDDKDDYTINRTPIISSVQTGNAEVTAVSATAQGVVEGLKGQASAAYSAGIYYSTLKDPKSSGTLVQGSVDEEGRITATISGLQTNTTYYYCSFVTLQKQVTCYGEVKSFTTTAAKVTSKDAVSVTAAAATLGADLSGVDGVTVSMKCGVILGMQNDKETLKEKGFNVSGEIGSNSFDVQKKGLLPNTTYYFLPYLNVGSGYVYGDIKSFTTGSVGEPVYVDLGLSVLWATCNVGSEQPEDMGGLYGWGELTGLLTSKEMGDYGSATDIYGSAEDVAFVHGLGRLPSEAEIKELVNVCKKEWVTLNGVEGCKFTAANGNSIFLPAAGYREGEEVSDGTLGGYYWTGTINQGNKGFGKILSFNNSSAGVETALRYQALSIRPVKKAPKEFKKELLHKKWYIDLDAEGKSYAFGGPLYYYGTAHGWTTVSDGDIVTGDNWSWTPAWTENQWIAEARAYGEMTFTEDGKVIVDDYSNGVKYEGTYTVNESERTITLSGANLLHMANFDGVTTNWNTGLKILSLTENGLQIAVMRTNSEGPALLSFNFVSADLWQMYQAKVYTASLCLYDGDGANWNSYTNLINNKEGKQYVVTALTLRNAAQVYILDIPNLLTDYPNAIVRIDKIEADGNELAFDANKFKYGNIEGKGTYRIELFNIWGAGTASDSPFGGGAKSSEPALAFETSLKVYFTIVTLNGFEAELVCVDSGWTGSWPDAKIAMPFTGGFPQEYTVEYKGTRKNGMINFVEVKNFSKTFPNVSMTLKKVTVDGKKVPFDASKVISGDIESKGNYRIELFNTYGGTKGNAPFAGETSADGNQVIPDLGFESSLGVTFTLDALY